MVSTCHIIEAVDLARKGKKVRRKCWYFVDSTRCNYIYGVSNRLGETYGTCMHIDGNSAKDDMAHFIDEDVLAEDWEVIDAK